jgi:hypothetical protein
MGLILITLTIMFTFAISLFLKGTQVLYVISATASFGEKWSRLSRAG